MLVELVVFLITTLVAFVYYMHRRLQKCFKDNDVKFVPPLPIFGNTLQSIMMKKHNIDNLDKCYKAFPDERYIGYFEGAVPIYIIRDPEIMKLITVKDFDHFVDHKDMFPSDVNPLFGNSLLFMKGDRWRDMRMTLSPAFTGSKMRLMAPFMKEISCNIIEYLRDHINEDVDVDDLMRRYTNDVIASAGFGLQVNSLKDRNNEFYRTGQQLFSFTIGQNIRLFLITLLPQLTKKLGIAMFPEAVTNFFNDIVKSSMEYRSKNNVERPDMIQLLIEASKGSLKEDKEEDEPLNEDNFKSKSCTREWSPQELASQVFIFFAAGFETSASALALTVHELALNSDIQERLYQEIKEFQEKNKDIKYENINSMVYLDCIVNETLRKWCPAIFMDRICTKAYELPPPREGAKPVTLKPGDLVYNLVNSIQMDPKYHPDPQKYDPDRFANNKKYIKPSTFMPFGMGPRFCIGSRFALLEIKILLYYLILNFKILKCKKTIESPELEPHLFEIKVKGGTFVKFESRK